MKTREQVTAVSDVLIELWDDAPARESAWSMLRADAARIAAERPGWALDPHGRETDVRHVLWMRVADGVGGEPMAVETTREHAEFARLRLVCWATKD